MFESVKWFLLSYSCLGMIAGLFSGSTLMEIICIAIGWLIIGLLQVTPPRWHVWLTAIGLGQISCCTWVMGMDLWQHSIFSPGIQWWILPMSLLNATLANRWNISERPIDMPHV